MNNLLVSYDLMRPGKNYQPVYDYLESFSDRVKPLQSVYLIRTAKTAVQVRDELIAKVDSNDKILVIRIDTSMWGTFNLPNTAKWLKTH